jgi:hypothetical protein
MSRTFTNTSTYTVIDIRKTFEGFNADLRMIAVRTDKLSSQAVENFLHDIMQWAEGGYISYIDVTMLDSANKPIKATRYTVNSDGTAVKSERAGNNSWQNIPNTSITIIVHQSSKWHSLSSVEQEKFKYDKGFKISWGPSKIDSTYSHLSQSNAQLYASNGYELKKVNFS